MSNRHPTCVVPSLAGESRESRRERLRGVRWFLALAFGITWGAWAGASWAGYSLDQPVVQLATAAFVPALAAVITRLLVTREGFADAGLRPRLRSAWRQYVVAVATSVLVLAFALLLCAVFGVWQPSPASITDSGLVPLMVGAPVLCLLAAPAFWGEEFGWTAYLRNRLMPGRPVASTFAVGLIWGVWHWPLPFIGYFGPGRGLVELLVSLGMWLVVSVVLEFVISWLWFSSGSVWPSCVLHAGSNLVVSAGMIEAHGEGVNVNVSAALMCLAYLPLVVWIIATGHVGDRSSVRAGSMGASAAQVGEDR